MRASDEAGESDSACLAAADILAYLGRELPPERILRIEEHLDHCRLCSAAVEGVGEMEGRERFLPGVESLNARVRARSAAARHRARALLKPARAHYLALAATLVVGLGAGLYLTRQSPGQQLFAEHFEPYPSTRPLVRGEAPKDPLSDALARYEARDYESALRALEEILARQPDEPTALFYSGIASLCLGQPRPAASSLERVLVLGGTDYRAPAEWYLALAHLRMDDRDEARARLERISAGEGFYRQRAADLLGRLGGSRRTP
jgi:tetratricopeptide (TPR) repeat protein